MTVKSYRQGVVVGKFAPLHKGHEYLIDAALAACEQVAIVSYSNPEHAGCAPARRRAWLERRFPSAQVVVLGDGRGSAAGVAPAPLDTAPASVHRRFVGSICRALELRVDAVFTSEAYGPGFAAELTEYYREREPSYGAITHVAVDPARVTFPISATRIREDVHGARTWLSPEVYAAFVQRVAVLGGESSGKSTLARALADAWGTRYVPEYGRELWLEKQGKLELTDMLAIAQRQVALEDEAAGIARRCLFCDTSPLTTALYSEEMFGVVVPELAELARRPYALTVCCAPDFPFVQDGTRRDADFRAWQHERTVRELARLSVPVLVAEGSVEERVRTVTEALAALAS